MPGPRAPRGRAGRGSARGAAQAGRGSARGAAQAGTGSAVAASTEPDAASPAHENRAR